MSNEITQEMRDKLDAMRAKMTDGFIGEGECGCVFACLIFDPNNKKDTKEAMKTAGEWVKEGLIPKRVKAEETKRIAIRCQHDVVTP